ncbi:MAG: choice-of-anchor B family protein, partial [Rhodothermales bacterium]|nr:choice-of-anchor B family protein [Rhodothermales bacterium]
MSRFRSALLFVLATVLAGPAAAQLPTYGLAAAVGDDAVFVGQPLSFDGPGAVFVFERGADGAWAETHLLTAPDGVFGDGFGGALALDGARLLVGAASQSPFPNAPPPSAFVFERDADGRWQRTARLVLDPPVPTFGLRVALEGDVALVSAFAEDQMAGAAYVFRHANGTWTQEARLQPAAAEAGHRFGMAVALDGGRALIGAPGDGPSGAAYVFRHDGGAWTQEARLAHDDLGEDAGLGSAVYLHGDDALAGAPGAETVALFHAEGDGWMPHGALQPFVATPGFGSALAVTTDGILVGAPAGTSQPGAAYLFRHDADGSWTSAARLPATEPQTADLFGSATAARGDRAVVSAPGGDYSLGRVSVFERDAAGAWHEAAVLFSTTDPMASVTGEPRPCQGGEAAAFGCDRVDLISFLSVEDLGGRRGVIVNDLWGWTDPQTEGEYAVVGRNDGTVFIDLSDPANPIYLGFLPRTEGSPAATWRDVKVYRDHAFIVADGSGAHGMQVFDLTRLRDVQNPPVTFTPDVRYEGIASAHNIAINEETGIAYAVGSSSGGETCGG